MLEVTLQSKTAVSKMYGMYRNDVYRLCLMYLKDISIAEDAMQDTFLKALRSYPSFRGECSEKTWLMHIAVNMCHDYGRTSWLRHLKKETSLEYALSVATQPDNDSDIFVLTEIQKLPTKSREVIMLRYYQQLSIAETASVLGLSVSAVNSRLAKAKSLLKQKLVEVYFNE